MLFAHHLTNFRFILNYDRPTATSGIGMAHDFESKALIYGNRERGADYLWTKIYSSSVRLLGHEYVMS